MTDKESECQICDTTIHKTIKNFTCAELVDMTCRVLYREGTSLTITHIDS